MRGIYKKQFSEKIYDEDARYIPAHGKLLWLLFRKLQKFHNSKEDVVASLLPKGGKYLDIGCGDGILSFKAESKFEEIFGMDIAGNRIRRAKERNQKGHFFIADLDDLLPFKDEIFDVVTCIDTLQYCFDPCRVVKEFHRILRKDGVFIIHVPNIAWFPYRIKLLFGELITPSFAQGYGWYGGVLHNFTLQTLEDFLKREGFRIIKRTGSGVFSKWRAWWLSLLSGDIIVKTTKV